MKLQSKQTLRFDPDQLRLLVRKSRPVSRRPSTWVVAGLVAGAVIVGIVRVLG